MEFTRVSLDPVGPFSPLSLLRENMKFKILGILKGSKFIPGDLACLQPPVNHTGEPGDGWPGPFLGLPFSGYSWSNPR